MQWLMMNAWADSTKKALSTEYKAFKAYCRIANIWTLPVTGHQLAVYAVWLLSSGRLKSTGSLLQYLSAVRTLHRRIGLDCPTPKSYGPLDMVVRGSRRSAKRPVHRTLPVNPQNPQVHPEHHPHRSSFCNKLQIAHCPQSRSPNLFPQHAPLQ